MAWSAVSPLLGTASNVSGATSATVPTSSLDTTNWSPAAIPGSVSIALNPGESCVCQLWAVSHASVASDVQFRVLTSPDGGTSWDTTPYMSGTLPQATATTWSTAHSRTITVYGVKMFKIQFASTAASSPWTINGTNATAGQQSTYIKDGISA